jgi:hypothetical protein
MIVWLNLDCADYHSDKEADGQEQDEQGEEMGAFLEDYCENRQRAEA